MAHHLSKEGWMWIDVLQFFEGRWDGFKDIGKWIMVGWAVGLGIMIVTLLMMWFGAGIPESLESDHSIPEVFQGILLDHQGSARTKIDMEFSSTSTTRTNTSATTATTTTTTITDSTNDELIQNRNHVFRVPPHKTLARHILPDKSTWHPYYLQAFHRTELSLIQQDAIAGGHVDAPPSSGTRNNKDGCVGKIVLDKNVVKKHLKDGIMVFREGVKELVSCNTLVDIS